MVEKNIAKIWTIEGKSEASFLKQKAKPFDFDEYSKKDINDLVLFMRKMMVEHRGVGLAAPQIGFNMQMFVAQLPSEDGRGYTGKFYSFFNPKIEFSSKKSSSDMEGCLSVPGYFGNVERAEKITISGYDKNKRRITMKVEGFLARIFQHETDHLNGTLFIDKAKDIKKYSEELLDHA
jgi:peptide deformylase